MFETFKKGGAIMADEGFKRKLAAILSADVEGYSRLMDDNEEATAWILLSLIPTSTLRADVSRIYIKTRL